MTDQPMSNDKKTEAIELGGRRVGIGVKHQGTWEYCADATESDLAAAGFTRVERVEEESARAEEWKDTADERLRQLTEVTAKLEAAEAENVVLLTELEQLCRDHGLNSYADHLRRRRAEPALEAAKPAALTRDEEDEAMGEYVEANPIGGREAVKPAECCGGGDLCYPDCPTIEPASPTSQAAEPPSWFAKALTEAQEKDRAAQQAAEADVLEWKTLAERRGVDLARCTSEIHQLTDSKAAGWALAASRLEALNRPASVESNLTIARELFSQSCDGCGVDSNYLHAAVGSIIDHLEYEPQPPRADGPDVLTRSELAELFREFGYMQMAQRLEKR